MQHPSWSNYANYALTENAEWRIVALAWEIAESEGDTVISIGSAKRGKR